VQRNGGTVGTYVYNAAGQRVGKTATLPVVSSQRFAYDEASQLIGEYGNTSRDYIWLGNLPVAVVDTQAQTSTISYVTTDGLGTPRSVSDASGNTVWQLPYQANPFGEQQPASSTGYTFNLRSPGEYYDAESGLDYNIARTREGTTGRFLQSDPIGLVGGMSTYAAVGNNPMSYIDPDGRQIAGTVNNDNVNWAQRAQDNVRLLAYLLTGTDIDQVNPPGDDSIQSVVTPLEFMAASRVVGGARAASTLMCGSARTTTLFRAVGPAELSDINATGSLRNLGSAEGKYFTTSAENASSYAQQAVAGFGDAPYTLISTDVSNSILDGLTPAAVDRGIPAYVIPNANLPGLVPRVSNQMPLPPLRP